MDGLGLELDHVLDEEGVDCGAGAVDLGVALAFRVQAKPLDALLDLLFPLLAGVLEGGMDILTLGANVVYDVAI